ncbi:Serine/threonine-protein kinase SSN3 [Diplonema papillatum]|nr:Serine/threonine-protein kinase SSN3 [Diplonema papillatum]
MNRRVEDQAQKKFQQLLARYTPGKLLGTGGFSKVWEGKGANGESVAIKMLHLNDAGGSSADGENPRGRRPKGMGVEPTLLWELRVLGSVRHVNLITIENVSFKVDPPSMLLYLPLLSMDLGRITHGLFALHRHLSATEVRSLCGQALCGLEALHLNGVIHRDIKPANMLVDIGTGCLKLIDFGWARFARQPLTSLFSEGIPGTVWYRAPEVVTHARTYGPAFDMWSLGCVFFETIAGQPLFKCETESRNGDERKEVPDPADGAPQNAAKRRKTLDSRRETVFFGCSALLATIIGVLGAQPPPENHRWHAEYLKLSEDAQPYNRQSARERMVAKANTFGWQLPGQTDGGDNDPAALFEAVWELATDMLTWNPQHRVSATVALDNLPDGYVVPLDTVLSVSSKPANAP